MENAYAFSGNTFTYSMPRMFRELGYQVNAFHMNKAEYYSRGVNYKSWGYDHYFGLMDIVEDSGYELELDRQLVQNETFYKNMFPKEGNVVDYIITYSLHMPFNTQEKVGKLLAEMKYKDGKIPNLSEEEVAYLQAGEADYMVGLLIQALKDNGLYDNTVLVCYADHYLFTMDKNVLSKYKDINSNMVNHTPFFIWSSDMKYEQIKKPNMQIDILPTVLNLFGIPYDSRHYIGADILSDTHPGYIFFQDGSWYDGKLYVKDGKVVSGGKADENYLEQTGKLASDTIRKNDLSLKSDYFFQK